jgi:hypothetical protein
LRLDGLPSAAALAAGPGRQHDKEALLGELLGDGAADTPADADGEVAVVDRLAVRELGVAPVGLPLGGGANDDGDLFTGWAHVHTFPVAVGGSQ